MFTFDRAALYAARYGVSSTELREALMSGELPAGGADGIGWIIQDSELQEWLDRHHS